MPKTNPILLGSKSSVYVSWGLVWRSLALLTGDELGFACWDTEAAGGTRDDLRLSVDEFDLNVEGAIIVEDDVFDAFHGGFDAECCPVVLNHVATIGTTEDVRIGGSRWKTVGFNHIVEGRGWVGSGEIVKDRSRSTAVVGKVAEASWPQGPIAPLVL